MVCAAVARPRRKCCSGVCVCVHACVRACRRVFVFVCHSCAWMYAYVYAQTYTDTHNRSTMHVRVLDVDVGIPVHRNYTDRQRRRGLTHAIGKRVVPVGSTGGNRGGE